MFCVFNPTGIVDCFGLSCDIGSFTLITLLAVRSWNRFRYCHVQRTRSPLIILEITQKFINSKNTTQRTRKKFWNFSPLFSISCLLKFRSRPQKRVPTIINHFCIVYTLIRCSDLQSFSKIVVWLPFHFRRSLKKWLFWVVFWEITQVYHKVPWEFSENFFYRNFKSSTVTYEKNSKF